jgi:arabinose-5-phosphate isomerase
VLGDALAVALLEERGFSAEDFAFSHPGGSLGRKLLLTVEQLMHTGERVPSVSPETTLSEGLFEISRKGFGLTAIVDSNNKVEGLFTDGDLRRAFDDKMDLHHTNIGTIMTRDCKTISKDALAAEALRVMEDYKITGLLVTETDKTLVGVIHMHDLLKAGVV